MYDRINNNSNGIKSLFIAVRRSPPKKRQATPPSIDKRANRSPVNKRKRVSIEYTFMMQFLLELCILIIIARL